MEGEVTQQKHQEAGLVPVGLAEETRMEVTTGQEVTVTTAEVVVKEKKESLQSFSATKNEMIQRKDSVLLPFIYGRSSL